MISLSPRLLAAAGFVRQGVKVADVGTDHAYLPVYLLENGIITSAVACDIGEGPLKNAAETVSASGLSHFIDLRLSDGLQNVSQNEAEDIIICGMGGELIVKILSECGWIKDSRLNLILQPMTHTEDVRRYLFSNGFFIKNEICTVEGKRTYLTLNASFGGESSGFEEGRCYFGEFINSADPGAVKYVKKQLSRIMTRADALKNVGRGEEEEKTLRQVIEYYEREKNK
ncbi:MAG: SAM-dependent methyltransferase [Clostridia bacterium]|nr:SAM-dependent methyltransferase [Clostridia bacterium]